MFDKLFSDPAFGELLQGIMSSNLAPADLALATMVNLLGIKDLTPEQLGAKTIAEVGAHIGLAPDPPRLDQIATVLGVPRANLDTMTLKALIAEVFTKDPATLMGIMGQILGGNG